MPVKSSSSTLSLQISWFPKLTSSGSKMLLQGSFLINDGEKPTPRLKCMISDLV